MPQPLPKAPINPPTQNSTLTFKNLIKTYQKQLLGLLALVTIVTGLSLSLPNLAGQVIKSIEIGTTNWNLIYILAGVGIILFIVEMLQIVVGARFREQVGFDLRRRLMNKVVTQNYTKVSTIGIGQIITLFGSDINNVKDIMAGELVNSVKAILLFLGALILIFITNWQLGFIAFVSLPVIILAFFLIFKNVTKYFKLSQENQSSLNNTISQNIYGVNLVKVQNAQTWETSKFGKLVAQSRDISYKIIGAFSALIPIINTVTNWTTFGIFYFAAILYINNSIKLGDINTYIGYYTLLSAPIFIIGFNSQGIARMGVSLKRINELLDNDDIDPTGVYRSEIKQGIELKDINLEYSGKKVLQNINLKIKLGDKTAILGPTGAGKSQLIGILTGMIKPTSGEVLVDSVEISDWDANYLKDRMTTVFQDSLIFSGDLQSNVIINREWDESKYNKAITTATLNKLNEEIGKKGSPPTGGGNEVDGGGKDPIAIDSNNPQATLDPFIRGTAKNSVSELGSNLSGGQKQRLTLARALYNDPQILILDDFTARVDKATENKIQELLTKNYPDTTIVSITQNIETIKNYDQIILLMEGELLATGTHNELMSNSPEYQLIQKSQVVIE